MEPIALFGGTFDPVHYGHLGLARAAFTQLEVGRMILLPAGNPYQKGRLPYASGTHRAEMLRLAFPEDADIEVDTRELQREGPSYTFDTLRELRAKYGRDASMVWLIGADAFAKIDTWHRWDELFELAHFAVIDRPAERLTAAGGTDRFRSEIQERIGGLLDTHFLPSGRVVLLGVAPPPVSSTDIRARVAAGESIRGLTPDAVCDYIERNRLYQTEEKP